MLDSLEVAKLENLWKKRYKKIVLKNSLFGVLCLCALFALFYFLFDNNSISDGKKNENLAFKQDVKKSLKNSASNEAKNLSNDKAEDSIKDLETGNNEQEIVNNSPSIDKLREQLKEEIKAEITQETIEREELKREQEEQLQVLKQKARRELEQERMNQVANEMNMQRYFSPQNADDSQANFINPQNQRYVDQDLRQNENTNFISNTNKPKGIVKITSGPAKPKKENDDVHALEQSYKDNKEPKYALDLARRYYDEGDFQKAAKWAYELNSVDKDNPQGWIIFAKSKYKSGNKADALRVLEAYKPKASNQGEIQELINQMKQNLSIK